MLERIRNLERKRRMESNEGHGYQTGIWTDAKEVIEKTDSLLTKADPLLVRVEALLARVEKFWLFKLLGF